MSEDQRHYAGSVTVHATKRTKKRISIGQRVRVPVPNPRFCDSWANAYVGKIIDLRDGIGGPIAVVEDKGRNRFEVEAYRLKTVKKV